jgi:uncharacterized protein YcnI
VRRVAAAATAVAALALPAAAAAHVVILPPFVQDGEEAVVSLQVPNERPPHATVEVDASAPPGITVVGATAPAGWLSEVHGNTATWRSGRIGGRQTVAFPLRILARVRAGTYAFRTEQHYDDGAVVRWASDLSVLPAVGAATPRQHPWSAIVAAVAGIIVIAGSLVGLRLLRRRSLQEK